MAGPVRGKIDCFTNAATAVLRAQEMFKGWYDHMQTLVGAGVVTRVAYQFGDSAAGTDYHDGGSPFLNGAWALYRWAANANRLQDFYILGQFGDSTTSTDGAPFLVDGTTAGVTTGIFSFAFASALETDGVTVASPWNGDTDDDGADTKGPVDGTPGSPVWAPPASGTLAIWPMSNNFDDVTNKENTVSLYNTNLTTDSVRFGFISDDDNFFAYIDVGDNLNQDYIWIGPHLWGTGLDPVQIYSLLMIRNTIDLSFTTNYGDGSGAAARQGGLYETNDGFMYFHKLTSIEGALLTPSQPSTLRGGSPVYEEFPIYTYFDSGGTVVGMGGMLDPFIKVLKGVRDQDTKSDLNRFVVGVNGVVNHNTSVPWDGTSTPGVNATRQGIDF